MAFEDFDDEQAKKHLCEVAENTVCSGATAVYRMAEAGVDRNGIWFQSPCDANCGGCPVWVAILNVCEIRGDGETDE